MKKVLLLLAIILSMVVMVPQFTGGCDPTSDDTPC
jgi:hypothetical protein